MLPNFNKKIFNDMIKRPIFKLNGILYEYLKPLLLNELLEYLGFNFDVILVDYNGTIIHRQMWKTIQIQNHDNLEIVTLAGGG